ncbi:MAG TPA: right-handed parallel beta-helix repeat-containing protein [Pirellulales bacterium]|nr:right-handed parallel beta-helix repeat-containing protein [Pirellulales bacterium]
MNLKFKSAAKCAVNFALVLSGASAVVAAEWYVAPVGSATGDGTRQSPWDLESALLGRQKIAPGDTVWLLSGIYHYPDRRLDSAGYVVRLAGTEAKSIQVRSVLGERVTIDGGLTVQAPASWLQIRDLEILVSENLTRSRTVQESGSHPSSYDRLWGGLQIHAGKACQYIHLTVHDCAQGVAFWSGAADSEIYGCLIYDNGWKAPDRGHGHAIYTQNKDGLKTITNCIITGGYSYSVHAYGSKQAFVDHYLIQQNICYDAGRFLVGGERPSHDIRVLGNSLANVGMQIGYGATENDDCEVRDNLVLNGDLRLNKFKKVIQSGNQTIRPNDPRPSEPARVVIQPSRYDPSRAHLAIFNWARTPTVALTPVRLKGFAKPGDNLRLLNPRDFYGKPLLKVVLGDQSIEVPIQGEFAAFVLCRNSGR